MVKFGGQIDLIRPPVAKALLARTRNGRRRRREADCSGRCRGGSRPPPFRAGPEGDVGRDARRGMTAGANAPNRRSAREWRRTTRRSTELRDRTHQRRRCDGLLVRGHDRRKCLATNVVREECPPGLGPGRRAAAQIARDGTFRNGESELQQFAVDPRSAPETILRCQTSNQISTGWIDSWSSRTSRATTPAPTYAFAMPTIDGGWLDQHQRVPPPGPQPPQEQPKQTISRPEAPLRTSENAELVAQGKRLEQEVSTRRPSRSAGSARPDGRSHRL